MNKRIVILFRKQDRKHAQTGYVISYLANIWREQGIDVQNSFGVKNFIPGDLAIVHVDLSVVPDEYIELAHRYPKSINAQINDIRKSTYSQNIVDPNSKFTGPVIVKSNYNFAGIPEQRGKHKIVQSFNRIFSKYFGSSQCYKIYNSVKTVPRSCFNNPNLIVEKFLPEKEGDFYHVRTFHFLGDRHTCARLTSKKPIVTGSTQTRMDTVEPHPDIIRLQKDMKFDYGKFDYVIHEDRAVLLDANKTVGAGALKYTPELKSLHQIRAQGIYSFLK